MQIPVFKYTLSTVIFLMAFLASKAESEIPEIKYANGNLKTSILPYDEFFDIVGSAIMANGDTADVVVVNIDFKREDCELCQTSKRSGYTYNEEFFWQRLGNTHEFRVNVTRVLDLENQYEVKIRFYKMQVNAPDLVGMLVPALERETAKNNYVENEKTLVALNILVADQNKKLTETDNFQNEDLKKMMEIRLSPVADSLVDKINSVALAKVDLAETQEKVEQAQETLKSINDKYTKDTTDLFNRLKITQAKKKTVQSKKDIEEIKKAVSKRFQEYKVDSLYATMELNNLIKKKDEILTEIKTKQAQVDAYKENLYQKSIVLVIKPKRLAISSSAPKTKSEEVRIHTDYAFAYTPYTWRSSGNNGQAFGYMAAKVYFCQLDKGMIRPYRHHWARRFSLIIGSILPNKLYYRGQKLDNVGFLPIKPVLGLGFDIVKFIGVNFGTIIFQQPAVSPFSRQSRTVFSPYFSISLDLNLVNQLKNFTNP